MCIRDRIYTRDVAKCDLDWTAPGDNGYVGTASEYDIRYDTEAMNSSRFPACAAIADPGAPQPAGTHEDKRFDYQHYAGYLHFALKTADEVPNWSFMSNVATTFVEPAIFYYTFLDDGETCVAEYRPRWEFWKNTRVRSVKIVVSTSPRFYPRPTEGHDGETERIIRFPIGAMYNRWQPDRGPWTVSYTHLTLPTKRIV